MGRRMLVKAGDNGEERERWVKEMESGGDSKPHASAHASRAAEKRNFSSLLGSHERERILQLASRAR